MSFGGNIWLEYFSVTKKNELMSFGGKFGGIYVIWRIIVLR
jgi:hypothetical protein